MSEFVRNAPVSITYNGRTPSFADTAAYFKKRAGNKRLDEAHRQRLLDTAAFYRRLARIAPYLPLGFRAPVLHFDPQGRLEAHALRRQARAEECRAISAHLRDPAAARKLLQLADTLDGLGAMEDGNNG